MKNTRKKVLIGIAIVVAVLVVVLVGSVVAHQNYYHGEHQHWQNDEAAMGEVANAINLAVNDKDDESVRNEVLQHSVENNVSCYIDNAWESQITVEKTIYSDNSYMYGDEARTKDETVRYAAGEMYGMTITFKPSYVGKTAVYKLEDGVINIFDNPRPMVLKDCHVLYEVMRSVFGDTIQLHSKMYGNSDYTIFINMHSADNEQMAAWAYGQFNGTNLKTIDDMIRVAENES